MIGYLGFAGLYRELISPAVSAGDTGELVKLAGQQNKLVVRYVVNNLEELSNLSEVISITPSEDLPLSIRPDFYSYHSQTCTASLVAV